MFCNIISNSFADIGKESKLFLYSSRNFLSNSLRNVFVMGFFS